jgi:ribosomal protein L40E
MFSVFEDGLSHEIICRRCRATLTIDSDCRTIIQRGLADFRKLHTRRHIAVSPKESADEDNNMVTQ